MTTHDLDRPGPCAHCGHQKGIVCQQDGCLGMLPGVVDACCGHGDKEKAYIHFQNGVVLRGFVVGTPMPADDEPHLWVLNLEAIEGPT